MKRTRLPYAAALFGLSLSCMTTPSWGSVPGQQSGGPSQPGISSVDSPSGGVPRKGMNGAQKVLSDMMAFVDRAGILSGGVKACSLEEHQKIDACGELILSHWRQVTGEPEVRMKGLKPVFRAAWAKRVAEGALAQTRHKASLPCGKLLAIERQDAMWKFCLRTSGAGKAMLPGTLSVN